MAKDLQESAGRAQSEERPDKMATPESNGGHRNEVLDIGKRVVEVME